MGQQTDQSGQSPGGDVRSEPLRPTRVLIGLAALLFVFAGLCPAKLWRPGTLLGIDENIQIAEAQAWTHGELTLPERKWDTALVDGRVYSHFPPMFTFLSLPAVLMFGGVPHWYVVAFLIIPVLVLSYLLFLQVTKKPGPALALSIGLVCGTSALPVLEYVTRGAAPYYVNQMLGVIGQLLILLGLLGRPRLALAGIGFVVAFLSRQLTIAYILPILAVAWIAAPIEARTRRVAAALCFGAIAAGTSLTLNALKFGSPFDSGYMYLYIDRPEDNFSRDAKAHGLFSPHFVARNLYHMNLGLPNLHQIEMGGETEYHLRPDTWGTGIWWTSPLLLLVLCDIRRIWSDPLQRSLLIAAALVMTALLFYHSTGFRQRGFNRYSLDYVPVLFALIAPTAMRGWRKWFSGAAILWSVIYFGFLI